MDDKNVPIWEKAVLSVDEAMRYTGIGEKSIKNALRNPSCPFVFYIGRKAMVKRKEFEEYISKHNEL